MTGDLHILVYGLFGIGNTGNDATLEVTLAELLRTLPEARFTIVAPNPKDVGAVFGWPSVPIRYEPEHMQRYLGPAGKVWREQKRWRHARSLLRDSDCLLVAGTGVLDDFGASALSHPYQLWKWCSAARLERTPVKFVSVGAGPIEGGLSLPLLRAAARSADHRSYRDEASRRFAHDVFGLAASDDSVTPDLVFGLELEAPPPADEARVVGVGVMNYHNWLATNQGRDDYEPYITKLVEFADTLLAEGRTIKVLEGDQIDAEAADDFASRLEARAPSHAREIVRTTTPTLRALAAEIATTDAVVATRYHTIISALMCGRPAVSVGYAGKNAAVMRSFGLGEYCQHIASFDVATLRRHFDAVAANPALANPGLLSVAQGLRGAVKEHIGRLAVEIRDQAVARRLRNR
jgi:polysaccharide pyruvyl transferase WcaK-like protein